MKNSKTTIKELTRQYRSVLKKCLFLNAIALGLFAATSANAADDYADKNLSNITDAGKTVIVDAVKASVNAVDPDKTATKYEFKDPDGETVNIETGADLTADDYVADSAAKTETGYVEGIADAPSLAYDKGSVSASDYKYVTYDADGNESNVAGNVEVSHLTKDLELHELAGSKSITVSSDDGATKEVSIADYQLVSGTGTDIHTYTIEKDGDSYVLKKDGTVDTEHDDFKTLLKNAYEADVSSYDTLKGNLDEYYGDSVDNRDLIVNATTGFVTVDNEKITELHTNEAAMETKRNDFTNDKNKYDTSLGKDIDAHITNAITAENGIIKTAAQEFIQTTAANVGADQLGWDITASPEDEGSFAKSLEGGIYADLTAGDDRTVIGALNKIGEFIGTERTDDADPTGLYALFETKEAWAAGLLGVDTTQGTDNQLQNALASLEGTNNISATSITGALHELDLEKVNTSDVLGYADGQSLWADPSTASDDKVMSSGAVKAVVEGMYADANTFLTKEFGYDTTTTDAKTEYGKLAETDILHDAESFIDADKKLSAAIGDMSDFGSNNYATSTTSVAENLTSLDTALFNEASQRAVGDANTLASAKHYTDIRFNDLDRKIDKLEDKMEKGLAANAALAGLVPLSNAHKTQLSAAMGGYGSNQALAIGGFHYLNDQTLLNVGGAYGGNSDISYKVGVTFGF